MLNTNTGFLVSIDGRTMFLHQIGLDGLATGSKVPSAAWHFRDYSAADTTCQRLHKLGYREAVVVNHIGRPITADDLASSSETLGFLVKIDETRFVRQIHEQTIDCVLDKSVAKAFSQNDAVALAGKLRRRGFPRATVVETSGVTEKGNSDADLERVKRFWESK
jgi:hypothetical protein